MASPVKPIFFHEAAMTDCAHTARVPASAEIPSASLEAKEVNQQHRPAARGGKLTVGGVTSAHFGCAHFFIQDKSNNETVDTEDTGHDDRNNIFHSQFWP